MPDTKLRPTSKGSAMWMPQIASHSLNIICIKLVTQVKKKLYKNYNSDFLRFLGFLIKPQNLAF